MQIIRILAAVGMIFCAIMLFNWYFERGYFALAQAQKESEIWIRYDGRRTWHEAQPDDCNLIGWTDESRPNGVYCWTPEITRY